MLLSSQFAAAPAAARPRPAGPAGPTPEGHGAHGLKRLQSMYFAPGGPLPAAAGSGASRGPLKDVVGHRGTGMTSRLHEGKKKLPEFIQTPQGRVPIIPENTLRAFVEGMRQGADSIEFDVRLSKEREPMVIHDEFLAMHTNQGGRLNWSPLTKGEAQRSIVKAMGKVNEKTVAQLQNVAKYDLGNKDKIPTLKDTLHIISEFNRGLLASQGPDAGLAARKRKARALRADGRRDPEWTRAQVAALVYRDEEGLADADIWEPNAKKLKVDPELPSAKEGKHKGQPRKRLVFPNIELKEKGRKVADEIFRVLREMEKDLVIQRVVFCGFDSDGMTYMRKLIDQAAVSLIPLKNWRGEEIVFEYSWGNTSQNLFKEGTVFGPGFVAYEDAATKEHKPFRFANTDLDRTREIVTKAKKMQMTSLDITSSDFDGNVAQVLAETGMKVVVTHVANRTGKQFQWRNWGRVPTDFMAQERWEMCRVMKLSSQMGVDLSYKADFSKPALDMKAKFRPDHDCDSDHLVASTREPQELRRFMAYAIAAHLLEQKFPDAFPQPPAIVTRELPIPLGIFRLADIALRLVGKEGIEHMHEDPSGEQRLQHQKLLMQRELKLWAAITPVKDEAARRRREEQVNASHVDPATGLNETSLKLAAYLQDIEEASGEGLTRRTGGVERILQESPKERKQLAEELLDSFPDDVMHQINTFWWQGIADGRATEENRKQIMEMIEAAAGKALEDGRVNPDLYENCFRGAWAAHRFFVE